MKRTLTLKEQLQNAYSQVKSAEPTSAKYDVMYIQAAVKAIISMIQEGIDQKEMAKVEGTMEKLVEVSQKLDALEKKILTLDK